MFSSTRRMKATLAFTNETYIIGPVFPLIWRWQVAERLGGEGGIAFTKLLAKNAARDALRRRKAGRAATDASSA